MLRLTQKPSHVQHMFLLVSPVWELLSILRKCMAGRSAQPLKVSFMDNKYYECLRDLVNEMGERFMNVGAYRSLFDHIYYVSFYQRAFHESNTPESEALARWSLGDARDNLEHIMRVLDFDDSLKEKIRYIANSSLSSVRL